MPLEAPRMPQDQRAPATLLLPGLPPGTKVRYRPYHGWDAPYEEPWRIHKRLIEEDEDGTVIVAYVLVPWETATSVWQGRRIAPVDAQQVAPWPTT